MSLIKFVALKRLTGTENSEKNSEKKWDSMGLKIYFSYRVNEQNKSGLTGSQNSKGFTRTGRAERVFSSAKMSLIKFVRL